VYVLVCVCVCVCVLYLYTTMFSHLRPNDENKNESRIPDKYLVTVVKCVMHMYFTLVTTAL
jgi:hypothetical protein